MSDQELIAIGRVVTTHGLRGELRVQLYNLESTAIQAGKEIILRRGDARTVRRVQTTRPHKRVLLVTLEGCASIEAGEEIVGCDVCIPMADLPPAGADEVYHFELIGMQVVTTDGEELGNIAEVLSPGSNDVCVVRGRQREHLIPMIPDVVKTIDRENRRVVIDPLPGLLD